jgi:hypothetical protein
MGRANRADRFMRSANQFASCAQGDSNCSISDRDAAGLLVAACRMIQIVQKDSGASALHESKRTDAAIIAAKKIL